MSKMLFSIVMPVFFDSEVVLVPQSRRIVGHWLRSWLGGRRW